MRRCVGIIGMGSVGSSVAISTLHCGIADEVLLYDIQILHTEGEAMDLSHGASFYPSATVRVATLEEMLSKADVLVVTAGRAGKAEESRLDLMLDNAAIIRSIGRQLVGYHGVIVVLTNPVDVMTQIMAETTGLLPSRVLGTGTMLDTSRLRYLIGKQLGLDPHSIHAQVVGEHGDSEVVLWSSAQTGGVPLSLFPRWDENQLTTIENEVKNAAYQIISRKGSTNHAIGLVTANLLGCLLKGENRVLTVTRLQYGALGIQDVALSLPTIVGEEGATQVLAPEMNDNEYHRLIKSAGILRTAVSQLNS